MSQTWLQKLLKSNVPLSNWIITVLSGPALWVTMSEPSLSDKQTIHHPLLNVMKGVLIKAQPWLSWSKHQCDVLWFVMYNQIIQINEMFYSLDWWLLVASIPFLLWIIQWNAPMQHLCITNTVDFLLTHWPCCGDHRMSVNISHIKKQCQGLAQVCHACSIMNSHTVLVLTLIVVRVSG